MMFEKPVFDTLRDGRRSPRKTRNLDQYKAAYLGLPGMVLVGRDGTVRAVAKLDPGTERMWRVLLDEALGLIKGQKLSKAAD